MIRAKGETVGVSLNPRRAFGIRPETAAFDIF